MSTVKNTSKLIMPDISQMSFEDSIAALELFKTKLKAEAEDNRLAVYKARGDAITAFLKDNSMSLPDLIAAASNMHKNNGVLVPIPLVAVATSSATGRTPLDKTKLRFVKDDLTDKEITALFEGIANSAELITNLKREKDIPATVKADAEKLLADGKTEMKDIYNTTGIQFGILSRWKEALGLAPRMLAAKAAKDAADKAEADAKAAANAKPNAKANASKGQK